MKDEDERRFKFYVSSYVFTCLPVYLFPYLHVYGDLTQCAS